MFSKKYLFALILVLALPAFAQERRRTPQPAPATPPATTPPATTPSSTEPEPPARARQMEQEQQQPAREREAEPRPAPSPTTGATGATTTSFRFDMKETPASVTHHQVTVNGRALRYTATAGRLPVKNGEGVTEALMFYAAYTLDGADAATRPVTFAYNGGPGSASIWLHMGALGPKRVVLQPDGLMPPAPYRISDNSNTLLDKSDLVLVDAIGTGFSRAANADLSKKFWGVKGDIDAFSEFIRLYVTRYERWSSPLFLFGESYGTTRAAGIAGNLASQGISFNGITLLSTALSFQTL